MTIVREYEIPGMGNFGISHLTKKFELQPGQFVEPGFYGVRGIKTITKRYGTLEDAEESLQKGILKSIGEETSKLLLRQNKLTEIKRSVSKGISEYCNYDKP